MTVPVQTCCDENILGWGLSGEKSKLPKMRPFFGRGGWWGLFFFFGLPGVGPVIVLLSGCFQGLNFGPFGFRVLWYPPNWASYWGLGSAANWTQLSFFVVLKNTLGVQTGRAREHPPHMSRGNLATSLALAKAWGATKLPLWRRSSKAKTLLQPLSQTLWQSRKRWGLPTSDARRRNASLEGPNEKHWISTWAILEIRYLGVNRMPTTYCWNTNCPKSTQKDRYLAVSVNLRHIYICVHIYL